MRTYRMNYQYKAEAIAFNNAAEGLLEHVYIVLEIKFALFYCTVLAARRYDPSAVLFSRKLVLLIGGIPSE